MIDVIQQQSGFTSVNGTDFFTVRTFAEVGRIIQLRNIVNIGPVLFGKLFTVFLNHSAQRFKGDTAHIFIGKAQTAAHGITQRFEPSALFIHLEILRMFGIK